MGNRTLINDPKSISGIAEALAREDVIGVDTEFIRETTFFPKMALLQLSTENEVWLVDPVALGKEALDPILRVLVDPKVLKVMHAAYADQECLHWAYGLIADPVLDTAVAAALVGIGDNVGLGKLLREAFQLSLPKGRARAKWLERPLPHELIAYAAQDVAHLVRLARWLINRLEAKDRLEWAMEESRVPATAFELSPEEMARRSFKNGQIDGAAYTVLVELIRWREDRAKSANLPRGWVADNDVLVALAKVRPKRIEELRSFRGLNAKEVERQGQRILAAVERGRQTTPPIDLPSPRQSNVPDREDHVLDFVRTYVSFLADRNEIALRFLINTTKALQLVQSAAGGEEAWIAEGILSRRACKLIGRELGELLAGKRGLALRNGKVEILSL